MTPRKQRQLTYRLYRLLTNSRHDGRPHKMLGKFAAACDYAYLSRGDKLADRRPGYMLKSRRPMHFPYMRVAPSYTAWNCRCTAKPL